MINEKSISVIIPAYNEELLIEKTINTMPDEADILIIVNDASKDNTKKVVENLQKTNEKILLINHDKNEGVVSALITGYKKSLELNYDISVVMPGDAQALPKDFLNIVNPVANDLVDYSKGNRLKHKDVKKIMPRYRLIGNTLLTLFTKFASGYFHIMDPQMGYTALKNNMLKKIEIDNLIRRYGYPGHLLHMLNIEDARVCDVDITPHYGEEKSGLRLWNILPKLFFLLIYLFFRRVFKKFITRNLSPAGISYLLSFIILLVIEPILLLRLQNLYEINQTVPELTLMLVLNFLIIFLVLFLFGLMFDVQENKDISIKKIINE